MSTLSKFAVLEIHDLTTEARRLANGSAGDRKTADVLMAKVANVRACGLSSEEMRSQYTEALCEKVGATAAHRRAEHERFFRHYLLSKSPQHRARILEQFEERAGSMEAGEQNINYTEGSEGGFLVPFRFYDAVTTAMAQTDPLLSDKYVNLITEPSYAMRPKTLPGYDLTQIAAVRVVENSNPGADAFPSASSETLNGYPYKLTTYASFEIDQDDFESTAATIARAHGVGLARTIGQDLVNGTGNGEPGGLLTGASDSGYTTAARNAISYTDIVDIYFSVNRVYRAAPKCCWVMNDATLKLVRAAVDNNGRPLISVENDLEMLMGQPVLVSPSMPSGPGTQGIIFGDLSHFNVRLSALYFRKAWQAEFGIESGNALHMSRMRADSVVFDPAIQASPTNTTAAPIQYATLHS
jgi:HK97 family phage major capsid protein